MVAVLPVRKGTLARPVARRPRRETATLLVAPSPRLAGRRRTAQRAGYHELGGVSVQNYLAATKYRTEDAAKGPAREGLLGGGGADGCVRL